MALRKCEQTDRVTADVLADTQSLHVHAYLVRRGLSGLGPLYLGISESEESLLIMQQPWVSPLPLVRMTKPRLSTVQPDPSPFSEEPGSVSPQKPNPPNVQSMQPADIPALIYSLITIENARRKFAQERLKQSKSNQSERLLHHIAKRNVQTEARFESILVALKELVVLRTIRDPSTTQIGELKQGLGRVSSKQRQTTPKTTSLADMANALVGFDPAQCLSVLNLMFPISPLQADRRSSLNTNQWQQRYAFPLQHTASPRTHLHTLLCQVEMWIMNTDRLTKQRQKLAMGASVPDDLRTPDMCPAWQKTAKAFGWGQLRQSCATYVQDAMSKIMEQQRRMQPWTQAVDGAMVFDGSSSLDTVIDAENTRMLKIVAQDLPPQATVVERVVRHSQLVNRRFSPYAVYARLSKDT
ncbi:hypothetical protein FBU59_001238 [Linderina macrospora]|uniref:Uncharacterized protein n=1 Tax=Linderina macrospora TaxID=4868 RepID=A0ACC1JEH3_9FUNG|nr:hypothetical protein FBU59_001238 [Linderina macrospora]